MADLLLTHGYFLAEDEKERQIMKPYPPLGLLYLSAFLKTRGYSVDVFDSTFAERGRLVERFASERGTVGIYTTLMTRRSVLEIVRAAKQYGWRVVLGGPESANYTAEYLGAGADGFRRAVQHGHRESERQRQHEQCHQQLEEREAAVRPSLSA